MKNILSTILFLMSINLFSQNITSVSLKVNEKLNLYKQNENIQVYYVELFPGEKFDGWIYYYSNTTQKMYGNLIESPEVEWLKVSPNNFYSAGCDSINIIPIKYSFIAPVDTGLYQTIIKDKREFYNNLSVILHVTLQPRARELNVISSSCKTKIETDTISFLPAKHGCVEKYFPSKEGKILLSTYPKNNNITFSRNEFIASYYKYNEYQRYYNTNKIGRDTVYEITYMEWVSYPIYKKIILDVIPDENLVLNFNNICVNFPVIDCYVNLTDSCGNIIKDISNVNFEVKEDTVNEYFKILSGSTGDNLSIMFVIDRSGSMMGTPIAYAKNAAKNFVDRLGDNDIAALISFSSGYSYDEEYTKDKQRIKSKIDNLDAYGTTALYDALFAAAEYSKKGNCRNIIILLTDGGDNNSKYSADEAINKCVSYGFPVYCIGLGSSYDAQLKKVSDKTGGLFAHANKPEELNSVYDIIFNQIESQLLIRYTTHNLLRDSSLREVKIKVSNGVSKDEKNKFYYAPKDIITKLPSPFVIKPKNGETVYNKNILFNWSKISKANKYRIVVSSDTSFNNIILNQIVNDTFYIPQILKKGCNYYWKVMAMNSEDTSNFSTPENFFVVNSKPTIPTLLSPENNITLKNNYPNNLIKFTWSKSIDYDKDSLAYYLNIKNDSETVMIECNNDTTKVIDIKNIFTSVNNYSWNVIVYDGNDSTYSNTYQFNLSKDITNISSNTIPNEYKLFQNYPNPFNPITKIKYSIPKNCFVQITIYDVLGREVKTIQSEYKNPGTYLIEFNGSYLNSGVYYYYIKADDYSDVKKMILIK